MVKPDALRFRKTDLLAIAAVILLAVLVGISYLPKDTQAPVQAQIYHNGELLQTIPLDTDTSFVVEGKYKNTITVEDGQIAVAASDCPGEDCVHSAPIHASGRSIVCLPNALEIRVVNAQSDVDFVVG